MSEYTPTTEQVRRYWQYGANAWADEVAHDDDVDRANGESIGAQFDRWLAAHDRETARKAWDEGFDAGETDMENGGGDPNPYDEAAS